MRLGNYKDAEYQSRLGIEKCILFNHDYVIHNLYVNLAKCLQHDGKTDSAEVTLINTLQKLKKNTDKISISICLHTLGEVYFENKKYDKAYECFKEELSVQQDIHNENGIYLAYLNLGYTAANQNPKNAPLVQSHLDKARNSFSVIQKNPDILIESNLKTAKTYELINKPAQALNYYKLYYALNDSLLNKEKLNQIVDIQTKYETEQKEQQIQSLKQSDVIKTLEIKSQGDTIRKRNLLIITVVCFVLFLLIIIYISQQRRNIKRALEKELAIKKAEEKERVRMSKDIHDELGAKLSKINFLSELMAHEKNQNPHIAETAETIAETSRQIVTNMRDLIWVLNPENNTLSNLIAHMREYTSDYLEDFSNDVKLSFPDQPDNVPISNESHREILMTVKECLNNIVKHSQATAVNVTVTIDNKTLSIMIKDNGVGIPLEKKTGNGLRNMKTRIESLNGEVYIKSSKEEGTLVVFNIPLNKIIKS
jgi:signal transduction histidine kinase